MNRYDRAGKKNSRSEELLGLEGGRTGAQLLRREAVGAVDESVPLVRFEGVEQFGEWRILTESGAVADHHQFVFGARHGHRQSTQVVQDRLRATKSTSHHPHFKSSKNNGNTTKLARFKSKLGKIQLN